jgi:putative salt-induced outer membrane protein YdiY
VELGLSGTEGNSQLFKVRAAGNAKYETKECIFKTELLYAFANANDERTENRLLLTSRYEWLLGDTPWSIFVRGELEYDEFKAYDVRVGLHSGVGYTFFKDDTTLFKGRVGAGASREIGGPENRIMPEGLIGLDFEHKFTGRQKIAASVDFFPDLGDIGEYRAELKACYEILIDPEWNLTFKIGALDRYDSTPEGRKANDIEYFALLVWKF